MLNLHCAGELGTFLMSTQAPSSNSNSNLFGNDEIVDQSFDSLLTNIDPCVYYNYPQSIPNRTPSSNDLLIVHVNIRSLTKNFDDLSHFLSQFSVPPDVICITETRLKNASFVNIFIPGYEFVFADSFSSAGGVGVASSSFGGASLPRQMGGPRPRVYPFTTLATKLLGSDADCKGLQPASCFVIQNH